MRGTSQRCGHLAGVSARGLKGDRASLEYELPVEQRSSVAPSGKLLKMAVSMTHHNQFSPTPPRWKQ